MTLDYPTDVAPREAAGKADADIAAELAASGLTARDLDVAALRPLIVVEWRLVRVDPVTQQRSGPLIDLYLAPGTPAPLKEGIGRLLAHLGDPTAAKVRTASSPDVAALWQAVVSLLGLSESQHAHLDTLHGGPRYAGVTAADVAEARGRHQAGELRAAVAARLNAAHGAATNALDSGGDAAAVKAAWLEAWGGS